MGSETRAVMNDVDLADTMVYEVLKACSLTLTDGETRVARITLKGMLRAQRNQAQAQDESDRIAAQFDCERFRGLSIQEWLKALAEERAGTVEAVNLLRVAAALDDYGVVVPPIDFGKVVMGDPDEPVQNLLYRLRATQGRVFIEGGLMTEAADRIAELTKACDDHAKMHDELRASESRLQAELAESQADADAWRERVEKSKA